LAGPGAKAELHAAPRLRMDKWLWQARFFKTRSLAAALIGGGDCRVNGTRVSRVGTPVQVGDVLTFVQGRDVRVVRITALGQRRGPSSEAQLLYVDLAPGGPAPSSLLE
jgi:ribosome-associated heat shock protein Hsp15